MTPSGSEEIMANLKRSAQSMEAAEEMARKGYYDFAASRAYYGVFYAATALLLREGMEFSRHGGVIAAMHQRFVKMGKLSKEHGKDINWLFELRNIGDYGGMAHVSRQDAELAIQAATRIIKVIRSILDNQ
jgi:uncharacterized protein (UPF0332 family)